MVPNHNSHHHLSRLPMQKTIHNRVAIAIHPPLAAQRTSDSPSILHLSCTDLGRAHWLPSVCAYRKSVHCPPEFLSTLESTAELQRTNFDAIQADHRRRWLTSFCHHRSLSTARAIHHARESLEKVKTPQLFRSPSQA